MCFCTSVLKFVIFFACLFVYTAKTKKQTNIYQFTTFEWEDKRVKSIYLESLNLQIETLKSGFFLTVMIILHEITDLSRKYHRIMMEVSIMGRIPGIIRIIGNPTNNNKQEKNIEMYQKKKKIRKPWYQAVKRILSKVTF